MDIRMHMRMRMPRPWVVDTRSPLHICVCARWRVHE